jgi:uncharacterized membrane protein YphA (DoxX/SURF4 family)
MRSFIHTKLQQAMNSYALSSEHLAVIRILFSLYTIVCGVIPNLAYLADLPATFYSPPISIGLAWTGFPPVWMAYALHIIGYVLCTLLCLGIATRPVSLALTMYFCVCYTFVFSLGKINHNTAYILLPGLLAWSSWGSVFSIDGLRQQYSPDLPKKNVHDRFVVFLYAFTLGWLYFTAAIPKIVGGWLSLDTQAVYGWCIQTFFVEHQQEFLASWFLETLSPFLWECADWSVIMFEGGFLIASLHKSSMRIWCCGAIFFHWLVINTLNIPSAGFIVCYLLFFEKELSGMTRGIHSLLRYRYSRIISIISMIVLACTGIYYGHTYTPIIALPIHFFSETLSHSYRHLSYELRWSYWFETGACVFVFYFIGKWLYHLFRYRVL